MRDFRNLKVWEKAHRLALTVYVATKDFPKEERFGLTSQVRRSVVSIASNIAEGCGRGGERELARFLDIAAGSAAEFEYQVLLARELHFLDKKTYDQIAADIREVKQMLASLIRKLRSQPR